MDKETLSNYGWIVIAVLVLSVMIALSTPFGNYIKDAVWSTTEGLFDVSENALNIVGMTQTQNETKTVSGNPIVLKNVAPSVHKLDINLSSDTVADFSSTNVYAVGKNIYDINKLTADGVQRILITDMNSGEFTITEPYGFPQMHIPAAKNTSYFASLYVKPVAETVGKTHQFTFFYTDGSFDVFSVVPDSTDKFFQIKGQTDIDKTIDYCLFGVQGGTKVGAVYKNIQIEASQGYTEYEPYFESKTTAYKDGSVNALTSISPVMTLYADNDAVTINCEYEYKNSQAKYNLSGKTIVNFGDSIFGNYRYPLDVSTYISNYTDATVYNVGVGGCRMATHSVEGYDAFSMFELADAISSGDWTTQENAMSLTILGDGKTFSDYHKENYNRLKNIDFSKVDIITIAYGTNDWSSSQIKLDNITNKYDVNTYAGAIRSSIEDIQTAYPNIEIVLCTPTYRFTSSTDSNTNKNQLGYLLTDYVQTIKDVAAEYNLTVIDSYYGSGIDATTRADYFPSNDGVHLNEAGRKVLAEYISKELYNNFK